MILELTIEGEPVAKGRPRFSVIHDALGNPFTKVTTPPKTSAAELHIAESWQAHHAGNLLLTDQLVVWLIFAEGPRQREKQQDVDNLAKLVLDALNGVAWEDDRQITTLTADVQRGSDVPHTWISVATA